MSQSLEEAIAYSQRWLDLIHKPAVSEQEGKQIIEESKTNFAEHFNRGWLEYRKSVTEAGDWAATEWTGRGAVFYDVLGREYIDCLGGYGLLDLGWSHPKVVDAVRAQLNRTPMPSQELIDPLRGVLARLMALITPGDIQYSFFAASGTEAIEGAIKLAKMYTRKNGFIAALQAFHGKTMGSLSMLGKADYRQPVGMLYGGPVYHVPFGDADAVERQLETCQRVGIDIAAVLMEPIQGEAGAIVPPDDFWPRLREMTRRYGVLLIADEVRRGADGPGVHRQAVGRGALERRPGHFGRRQIAGRRRDAGQRVLLNGRHLASHDASQPVHPHHHDGRRGFGVQRRHRRDQRHTSRAVMGASGCQGRVSHPQVESVGVSIPAHL